MNRNFSKSFCELNDFDPVPESIEKL